MFSFFGASSPSLSRIESCTELKRVVELRKMLHDKVAELKSSSDAKGAGSIEYCKYRILHSLLTILDTHITSFNGLSSASVTDVEILSLVDNMAISVARIRAAYDPKLATPRNYQRQATDISVSAGVYAASLAAVAALPFATVGTLIAFWYAGPALCGNTREMTGLNNHKTASIRLLDEWEKVLRKIKENLELYIPPAARIHSGGSNIVPKEFICPITLEIMKKPYLYILDGNSYEYDKAAQWLETHRTSPITRARMPDGATVADVLILNRNLCDMISAFVVEHPDFKYDEKEDDDDEAHSAAAAARM